MFKITKKIEIILFLFPCLIILIAIEYIGRNGFKGLWVWSVINPLNFLVNYIVIISIYTILILMFGRNKVIYTLSSFLFNSIILVYALISRIKSDFVGLPLLPSDLILHSETDDIVNYIHISDYAFYILLICFIIFLMLFFQWFFFFRTNFKIRLVGGVIAGFCIFSIITNQSIKFFHINNVIWDQTENFKKNGLVLSAFMNVYKKKIPASPEYSKKTIENISKNIKVPSSSTIKPNIIIEMNEAFWDPTLLETVSFSKDPLPFFHSLQKQYTSGYLISPQFGGGTSNVEFEVLTGLSMRFLPTGSLAYVQYVNRPIDSLASILTRKGYISTAVHSYHNWFYKRNDVYKKIGFSKFESGEFFYNTEIKGPFISDDDVSKKIIEVTSKTKEPDFVYAISMQNHGPYQANRYPKNNISISGLTGNSKDILETYAQGVADADQSLQKLVDFYSKSQEPTIIVFFGDHLPVLGDNYRVYQESNFISRPTSWDYESNTRMHSVPIVVWSNLPIEKEKIKMDPSFLGAYILDITHQNDSELMQVISDLYEVSPVIPETKYYKDINYDEDNLKDYKSLQYDILFGSNYLYQSNHKNIVNESYTVGERTIITNIGPDEITAVHNDSWSGETAIFLQGDNFIPNSYIFIDNKKIKTSYGGKNLLTAIIPKELYREPGTLSFQVKTLDSHGTILTESNKVDVPIKNPDTRNITIESVNPDEIKAGVVFNPHNGDAALSVNGSGFSVDCVIYLNGNPLPTAVGGDNFLTAIVPAKYYNQSGTLQLVVRDAKGDRQSEQYLIAVN
ncbi:sulfatase-like hydrolase/transferase [Paenibacillus sp. LMG 31458]|uniref:Sulfatase-like hydrolase/transferase n=1 Tax=Paenibacillus phytorum TaxID=2654977 RepID=A0ABX1Y0T0_9BACL|nr:LTA synthase family protein [Paenibacillus phytorum]NOU73896.1 sulfatase-like hydrolase/transferase [Paenibacillus phytorum]